jgi:hypothetical protein
VAFDIDFAERIIKASADAALKRMRQADEKLERAQRGTGGNKEAQLAEALEEYNRCVAELVDYLNVSSRHHGGGASKEG